MTENAELVLRFMYSKLLDNSEGDNLVNGPEGCEVNLTESEIQIALKELIADGYIYNELSYQGQIASAFFTDLGKAFCEDV